VPKRIEVSELFAAAEAVQQEAGVKEASQLVTESFLGTWVDSLGNLVSVYNTDAFETKLMATLSRPPRADIHLALRRVATSGWRCGNAVLDLMWSTDRQLHWLSENGRVSVWVKADDVKPPTSQPKGQAKGKGKGKAKGQPSAKTPTAAPAAAAATATPAAAAAAVAEAATTAPTAAATAAAAPDPEVPVEDSQKAEQDGDAKEAPVAAADEATAGGGT